MVIIDTSAWIEYFRNGSPETVSRVDTCLDKSLAGMGDLIYCEVIQGVRSPRQRRELSSLLLQLPCFDMVGFAIAERAALNYTHLRSKGVTVRKTIDVIIGTFCIENDFQLLHHDRDFDSIAAHLSLRIWEPS